MITETKTSTKISSNFMLSDFPEYLSSPIEFFDSFHARGPIHKINLFSDFPAWLITGYHLAKQALNDPRLCRDSYELQRILRTHGHGFWDPNDAERIDRNMLNIDPPDHSRLRKLAIKPFTPSGLRALTPRIEQITDHLLNDITPNQPIDLIQSLGYPLPMTVICELLDIPAGVERENFRCWSNMAFFSPSSQHMAEARKNIYHYLEDRIARQRAQKLSRESLQSLQSLESLESPHLLDQLINSCDNGDQLSDLELISTISLLLIAGHETTVNLIGNLAIELSVNKKLQAALRADPEKIPQFIEEVLRTNGPVHMALLRYASTDLDIGEAEIKTHDLVLISLLAANRDPAVFSQPAMIDVDHKVPKHLGFGFGPHVCLGAGLARLEATIVVTEILRRFTDIDLAVPLSDLQWRISNVVRGRVEVPVILHSALVNSPTGSEVT